jgi:hypothetical protein
LTRRFPYTSTSMIPTQFPTAKFLRPSTEVFRRLIASGPYPSLYLLPWPTPTNWVPPIHPSTQYSFSHSKAKHRVVYTTRDMATIHIPKCQQSKITGVLVGTDTTATKSKYIIPLYPNTSPSHTHTSTSHI